MDLKYHQSQQIFTNELEEFHVFFIMLKILKQEFKFLILVLNISKNTIFILKRVDSYSNIRVFAPILTYIPKLFSDLST